MENALLTYEGLKANVERFKQVLDAPKNVSVYKHSVRYQDYTYRNGTKKEAYDSDTQITLISNEDVVRIYHTANVKNLGNRSTIVAYSTSAQVTENGETYSPNGSNSTITSEGNNCSIYAASNNNIITSEGDNCSVIGSAYDTVSSEGNNCYVYGRNNSTNISKGNNCSIFSVPPNTIINEGDNCYIRSAQTATRNDPRTVVSSGQNAYIFNIRSATKLILSNCEGTTLKYGDEDDDFIVSGSGVYVDTGSGTYNITVAPEVFNATITSGFGTSPSTADKIYNNGKGNVFKFGGHRRRPYLYGFSADKDTIQIADNSTFEVGEQFIETTIAGAENRILCSVGSAIVTIVGSPQYGEVINVADSDGALISGVTTIDGEPVTIEGSFKFPRVHQLDSYVAKTGTASNLLYIVPSSNVTLTNDYDNVTVQCQSGGRIINSGSHVSIEGGTGSDYVTITGGAKDCTINTGAGNDYICVDNASGVYVDSGEDTDRVTITGDANNCTIVNGASVLGAYSNNTGGNVYIRSANSAITSIFGYKAEDTILIDGASYTQSVSGGLVKILYEGSTAGPIVLKGALKEGATAGSTVASNYDSLAGGTRLNISVKSGDRYVDCSTHVIMFGTTGADTMNVTLEGAIVSLGGGNDTVTVSGSNSSISAAAGTDVIYIESPAQGVTIFGGAANDSIINNSNGNIFQYTGSTAEGTDTITAFNSNDLFYINDSECTIADSIVSGNARLQITKGSTNTYVLIQGKTTSDTVRIKLGAEGAIQTYTIGAGFTG